MSVKITVLTRAFLIGVGLVGVPACGEITCRSANDCPLGFFCRLDGRDGTCDFECLEASDCPESADPLRRPVCRNDGRCDFATRLPKIRIQEPLEGARVDATQRQLRILGTIETVASQISVELEPQGSAGCGGTVERVALDHPEPGALLPVPFVAELFLPPRFSGFEVRASVRDATQRRLVRLTGSCVECPEVRLVEPRPGTTVPSPILPRLMGSVDPPVDTVGTWRVTDGRNQVFDGPLSVVAGRFEVRRVPLFGGDNRVEVLVDQAGGRCASSVVAPPSATGLRALLTWESQADFDLLLVVPDGLLTEPDGILSALHPNEVGEVEDDFDGFGPETLTVSALMEGVYGLAVDPLAGPPGAASLRLLVDGRLLTVPGIGPRFLNPQRGDVWLAAVLRVVASGATEVVPVDVVLSEPTDIPPERWPELRSTP
ncbi:MAG: hypothetical protein ACFB9M_13350 [Myxococcota bacterium]